MKPNTLKYAGVVGLMLGMVGCASGPGGGSIYVPAGSSSSRDEAPEPPQTSGSAEEPRVERKSEQPEEPVREPERSAPSYQDEGDALSPAAKSLIQRADTLMAAGDTQAAVAQLERAQRIAPRSAQVYFKLSEAYVALDQLGSAEQFTLKGLSLAGSDVSLQRSGWMLLADIRRARGNVAGANQAEERAGAL
ncbi:tetratricopeptide repeat protein [Marinobacter sp. ATCH36]|uniref:tetratricopeptide repeat protein n=1 Tax=Marinobacter sp. ATCH36 TaxID=2945106 RepID=UPI002020B8DC|nr:tetratricopeptide repeat protein [Marinobacter sp. ATCH36]MCL7946135.1 tetratricopeptide repeat protein [Marinobacter sp. ATCH36]